MATSLPEYATRVERPRRRGRAGIVATALGFATIALGSWLDTGLTHDWAGGDFLPSQCVEAVGLAFAITALVTYAISHITPLQAAAIATTIQIARLFGSEVGSAVIQTLCGCASRPIRT